MNIEVADVYKGLDPKRLGQRIRTARVAAQLTQRDVADGIMSTAYLSRVENGNRKFSPSKFEELAARLGVSIEWLLFGSAFAGVEAQAWTVNINVDLTTTVASKDALDATDDAAAEVDREVRRLVMALPFNATVAAVQVNVMPS